MYRTLSSKTTARIDLYVRDDIGDDSNPGTIALPLKTFAAAEALLPDVIAHPAIIHLGPTPGGGPWLWPMFRERVGQDHIVVIGDGAGTPGVDGCDEIISSTAALAGSGQGLIVASGLGTTHYEGPDGLTRGDLFGRTIEILTGDAAGDKKTIFKNTETTIVPCVKFTAPIAEGDLYRVTLPNIEIDLSNLYYSYPPRSMVIGYGKCPAILNDELFSCTPSPCLWLVNLRMCNSTYRFAINESSVMFSGVVYDEIAQYNGPGYLRAGIETFWTGDVGSEYEVPEVALEGVPSAKRIFSVPRNVSWAGWGISALGETYPEFAANTLTCRGYFCTGSLWANYGGHVHMMGGAIWHRGCVTSVHHRFGSSHITFEANAWNEEIDIWRAGSGPVICANGGTINLNAYYGTINVVGDDTCITARNDGFVDWIIFTSYSGAINLTTISGAGLDVRYCGKIRACYNLPTVSAPSGHDFTVDGGETFHSISELVANSHFADLLYGHIFRSGD